MLVLHTCLKMLVLPTGEPFVDNKGTFVEQLLECREIEASNQQFLQLCAPGAEHHVENTASKRVCVLQGEQALVPFGPKAQHGGDLVIGSVDATTCVIAVAVCRRRNLAWAAHYDERTTRWPVAPLDGTSDPACDPTQNLRLNIYHNSSELVQEEQQQQRRRRRQQAGSPQSSQAVTHGSHVSHIRTRARMLSPLLDELHEPELFLLGGYSEPSSVGLLVATRLLECLHACNQRFTIRLACLGPVNTCPQSGAPRAWNLAVALHGFEALDSDGSSNGMMSAVPYYSALGRAVEFERRAACYMLSPSSSPISIYDAVQDQFVLPGFDAVVPQGFAAYLARQLRLSDSDFLRECSTSPDHEPPHFVADQQAAYTWLLTQRVSVKDTRFTWSASAQAWLPQTVPATVSPVGIPL